MSGTCDAKSDVSNSPQQPQQSQQAQHSKKTQRCQWLPACWKNQGFQEVLQCRGRWWRNEGLCSILVGEISCGYMLTAKNMRKGKMFVENVFEECLTFFQKVDKVSSLEY